jgi:outer membrane protein assembly factor BamA
MLNNQMGLMKRFLAKRGFLQVDIELREDVDGKAKKVNLSFVCDIHRKKELYFEGNQFFTDDQLLDAILLFGSTAWMLPASMIKQEIEQIYRKKGFWSVGIDYVERPDAYFFTINEGARWVVRRVRLKRVTSFDGEQLAKTHFGALCKSKRFDDDLVVRSIDSLLAWYVGQGFLDVKLLKQEYLALDDAHVYELVLTLDEGDRSYLEAIELDQVRECENQGPFLSFAQRKEPAPFIMNEIHEQRRWLGAYLKTKGHSFVQIKPEFVREGKSITVRWVINTADPCGSFGKTVVTGSTTFPFAYIVRELSYQEGDPWDQNKLKETMLRFRQLGIFDTVHLCPSDMPGSHDGQQPILLKLQKDDLYELRMRAGVAVQQVTKELKNAGWTYRAGGSFLLKNPFNCADQVALEIDVARSERTFTVQYQRPWIFDRPIKTTIQGYNNSYLYPGLCGGIRNLYEVTQQGFVIVLIGKQTGGLSL